MSNSRGSRSATKRAAADYDEQDGDFVFTRAKRPKTAAAAKDQLASAPESPPAPKSTVKKTKVSRQSNGRRRASPPPPKHQQQEKEAPITTSKRPTRRKRGSSPPVPQEHEDDEEEAKAPVTMPTRNKRRQRGSSPPAQEEPLTAPRKRPTRRTRGSTAEVAEEAEEEQAAEPAARSSRINGTRTAKTDGVGKPSGRSSRNKQAAPVEYHDDVPSSPQAADTPMEKDPSATKIALPLSDTPINNRNKEFRKKGGAGTGGGRRSSMSNRGRRASSLIESGLSAMPHKEVDPSEFFKHIDAAIIEPKRMNHLLQWCGERALSEKPQHGTTGTESVLGARAIQDLLLKDFKAKSECSDWFGRDQLPPSSEPARPVVIHPNPINVQHDEKIVALEARIKRLKEQRKAWRALRNPVPQVPPLYPPDGGLETAPLPDASRLDAEEAKMLESLTAPSSSYANLKSTARSRLQTIQSSAEFKVDRLAHSIHKMDRRVVAAGKQADRVLALSSERLKEREEREKEAAGTKELPVMEVLRSLGRILPENGG
ncbi:unnamed protein product [Discula destructiva]